MGTSARTGSEAKPESARTPPAPTVEQILAHLEQVLASPVFRTSRRCQDLLRYVVENAALGRTDRLKERTIGVEVFSRPAEYEPSEDAIVRVNANEVRKRLAKYYLDAGREGVWIELPPGSYVPEFHVGPPAGAAPAPAAAEAAAAKTETAERRAAWKRPRVLALAGLAAAGALAAVWAWKPRDPMEEFWAPVFRESRPPLVCVPIGNANLLSYRLQDELLRQRPPFSQPVVAQPGEIEILPEQAMNSTTAHAVLGVALFIQRHGPTPEIRFSSQLATEELRERPLVLIGAFNNPWTLELNREIRFIFERQDENNETIFAVQDRQNPQRRWRVRQQPRFGYDSPDVDYAIVTRVFDPASGKPIVSAAGITQRGTRAAAEFITHGVYWEELAKSAPRGWQRMNLQVVLQTNVVNRTPKPPRVLAVHFWRRGAAERE
ncbi:MAG: hypothetical protein N2036_05740 [Bryobacteraceae bacterium]|nr:hypothetical protein [Bryobacteraceae bacterium]MCX7603561.1 hypothetical protein [Bryobacteraceae bacterium]MDW8434568.1 hypothetical protein [Arcobacter sp.]